MSRSNKSRFNKSRFNKVASPLRSERGTNPASFLIMLLLVLLIFELVAVSGRLVAAQSNVNNAAREAARRGTLVQNAIDVGPAIRDAASANLDSGTRSLCQNVRAQEHSIGQVGSPNGSFGAGGSVTATVSCEIDLSDLSAFGVPLFTMRLTAEHTEIIETYRAVGDP